MNRVSPQLFVTKEHIWSDKASTSSSSLEIAGEFVTECIEDEVGVSRIDSDDDLPTVGVHTDPFWLAACCCCTWSCKRRSKSPRSVFPSPSGNKPDNLRRDSILPSRFSNPSIYFALCHMSAVELEWGTQDLTNPLGGFLFFSTKVKTHSVL